MAWGRYRRYRRYRRYARRGFKRYFRRYTRKFINGSSKSTVRVKIPVSFTDAMTQQANATSTGTTAYCPLQSSQFKGSAITSLLYRTYCNLYDQVKLIGMKYKISIINQIGNATIPALEIYTAIDRNYGYGESIPSASEMQVYSTFQKATALNNSVAKLTRSCYASDAMEKMIWHDASIGTPDAYYHDTAWETAGANPNFFVPAFMMCMAVPTTTASTTINYSIDCMYYFAFRNPKYGGSTVNRGSLEIESIDTRARPVVDGDPDVDMEAIAADLDMEDRVPVTTIDDPVTSAKKQKARQTLARNKAALERRDPKNS